MTTLLSKAERAQGEAEAVSDEEIAQLEKEVSEQGEVVTQVKEVCLLSFCSIWKNCLCAVAAPRATLPRL